MFYRRRRIWSRERRRLTLQTLATTPRPVFRTPLGAIRKHKTQTKHKQQKMFQTRILPQITYPDKEDGSGATPTVTAVFTAVPTASRAARTLPMLSTLCVAR